MLSTRITRRILAKRLLMSSAAATLPTTLHASPNGKPHHAPSSVAWVQVHPGVWRARIGQPEAYTPVSSRLLPPLTEAFAKLPKIPAAPLDSIQGTVTDRGVLVELPLRPEEQVYGFGLQLLSFAQRGKKKTIRVNADPRLDTGDSHAPVPFYITTQGIGILVDTARYATFYVGSTHPKPTQPAAAATNANPDPNYTHNLADKDLARINVEVPRATGVDVYLFAGPTMLDAVRRYNVFSGGGALPPEWGLGFWYRANARANDEGALALAKELRDHKIPCDVFGLEPGWQSHAYSCTFAWDPERFPNPAQFLASTKAMDYRINLWEHAFTNPASPIFRALQPYSGDYGVWGGLVPDFAAPEARQIFGDYHGKTLIDAGVSGFKLDECDNSDFTGGWSFPEISRFPSGIDGEQMHSVFGLRYQYALWQQFRRRNLKTYNQVRSSGALATPYPFVLYSDLYDHRQYIRALANSGFAGLLWSPEVRDATSEEDLIRRLQSVVFSPLATINSWYIKNPPWRQLNRKLNNADQIMPDWEQVEARCREIIGWRMSLVPYLMRAFQQYAADGTPPFRALVLDSPLDPSVAKVDDQFLVGDRMMVVPLFAGEPSRDVIIPAGPQWHDFWTGAPVQGGSTLKIDRSTERIPVYVKTGSIIPWAEVGLHTGSPESRRITARVYGDGSLDFQLPGASAATLRWADGRGRVDGKTDYAVIAWQHLG